MEQAIKIAIENGWVLNGKAIRKYEVIEEGVMSMVFCEGVQGGIGVAYNFQLLDPLFWQALSKSEGYGKTYQMEIWHRFIDHLAEGKDINSFFEELWKKEH